MKKNNNDQSSRDALIEQLREAIINGNQDLWRKYLRTFMSDYGQGDTMLPDILQLAEDIANINPDAATDLITNGVLKKYIRVVITDTGYAVLQKFDTEEPLRERAAKTLLSLSAGNQMTPQKSIFAAWVAALNLNPETAAGKVAADQAFRLGKEVDSILIPAMARSIIELHTDPITIKEAIELWHKKLPLLAAERRIDEISKFSQITKHTAVPDLSKEWKKAMGELRVSASPLAMFNESEKMVINPDAPDSLRMTAARYWENVIDTFYATVPLAAVEMAEQTHNKLNNADSSPDQYKDIVANKLISLSEHTDSIIACHAIFAAANYRGCNSAIANQVRAGLENIKFAPGLSPELVSEAENKLKAFNRYHKPSGPGPSPAP